MPSRTFAIVDIETTGGRPSRDRITEIAIVLHDGEKEIGTFESLINPECPIPYGITELTGISNEMVADAPRFFEIAREIVEWTEGAVFVAHNVRFDYNFIREEFRRLGYTFSRRQLCTVRLSRKVFPGLGSYSLGNLIRHFGIEVSDRHRAMADTQATVRLFERIMARQNGAPEADHLVNMGIRESKLPQGISLDYLHSFPEACGVYYFHGAEGEVIYVGKSKNVRKRIMEHFADQTRKAAALQAKVRSVSVEVTGSELVALLLESSEIKRIMPVVNRAQKQRQFPYVVHTFLDDTGYRRFSIAKPGKKERGRLEIVHEYPKISHARGALARIKEDFDLCPRLLDLEKGQGPCFQYHLKNCQGACAGREEPDAYNQRAIAALDYLDVSIHENFFLLDEGREPDEYAVVLVEDGAYQGFGYLSKTEEGTFENWRTAINRKENNPEVRRMIKRYILDGKPLKLIPF